MSGGVSAEVKLETVRRYDGSISACFSGNAKSSFALAGNRSKYPFLEDQTIPLELKYFFKFFFAGPNHIRQRLLPTLNASLLLGR